MFDVGEAFLSVDCGVGWFAYSRSPMPETAFPPMDYSAGWLMMGIGGLIVLILYVVAIFFFTRHKNVKQLKDLPVRQVVPVDLTALRAKYLRLIVDVERAFDAREVKSSGAHQQLSMLVRYFAFEASGFRAHLMTLSDIQKADRRHLAEAIETFYAPEFDGLDQGSVANAAVAARKVVETWE